MPRKHSGHKGKKKKERKVEFLSQNVRGIKSDGRLDELFEVLSNRKAVAVCLQETWRHGKEVLEHGQYMLITSGLDQSLLEGKRGSQGVAIALSPDGVSAWKAAGGETHTDLGARVMAVRLLLKDRKNKDVGVFLISAYAPVGNASDDVWDVYFDQLDRCMGRKQNDDILVIGSDCNSSLGYAKEENDGPLGCYGLQHTNDSGRRFLSFLAINNLAVTTTRFKKKNYSTWIHPRSKKQHQIDHIIVNREMFHRVTDAGVAPQILDSDHRAISLKLRVMKRLKKKTEPRQKMINLDHTKLDDPNKRKSFCQEVMGNVGSTSQPTYTELAEAVGKASFTSLPKKERAQPGWFRSNASKLLSLIDARNQAMIEVFNRRTRSRIQRLQLARQKLKSAVKDAKNKWIQNQCDVLNLQSGTKQAWDSLKSLKAGLSKTKPTNCRQMKHPDGTTCKTPEENATVFCNHFKMLYGRSATYDRTVLDMLSQNPLVDGCDHTPTNEEIRLATLKLKNKAPGESGICPQAWKSLLECDETFGMLKGVVVQLWVTEVVPEEWKIGRLNVIPKKGDLSWPKNYRGIMLLEVAYKIIAIILHMRLLPIQESLDHEPQCGFRPGRGCTDAVFTIKIALKKRQEHGLESWVFFLDLVKAFDRVPRELLWNILAKFGVTPKLISLLKALHSDFKVKFKVDEVTQMFECTIGVKQGDILGPILFTFFMAAVMNTWKLQCDIPVCIFRTKMDVVLTGRSHRARGEEFPLLDLEYADDTAVLFDSREDITKGVSSIISHFARFGMEVHAGKIEPKEDSKSVILFCSKPTSMYENPDNYDNVDLSDVIVGGNRCIPIVDKFTYLGSVVSRDCTDVKDVDLRIVKAGNAFGSLRKCLFSSSQVSLKVKGSVYSTLILPILLYGAECWSLTEHLLRKLKTFHHMCLRAMCRVNRRHTRKHRISNGILLKRLSLKLIDTYICKQQLRWAGHVVRMPWSRLPRKMLSSWVRSNRPRGAPQYTYGRSLYKTLKKANIEVDKWHEMALDKAKWRDMIRDLNL